MTLVNLDQVESRTIVVQGGDYGEHRFDIAVMGSARTSVDRAYVTVHIEAGCGERIVFSQNRYAEQPTFIFPWDRAE